MIMTEREIIEFVDGLKALLDRFDPDDNPGRERVLATAMLAMTVATAAASEQTRAEFLRECEVAWDRHWDKFNEHMSSRKG